MDDREIENVLNEGIAMGHVKRVRGKSIEPERYSITHAGIRYVERELLPRVFVPASILNALCKRADKEGWRRDRVTKEIGTLILRCALLTEGTTNEKEHK